MPSPPRKIPAYVSAAPSHIPAVRHGQEAQKMQVLPSFLGTSALVLSDALQNSRFCVIILSRNRGKRTVMNARARCKHPTGTDRLPAFWCRAVWPGTFFGSVRSCRARPVLRREFSPWGKNCAPALRGGLRPPHDKRKLWYHQKQKSIFTAGFFPGYPNTALCWAV